MTSSEIFSDDMLWWNSLQEKAKIININRMEVYTQEVNIYIWWSQYIEKSIFKLHILIQTNTQDSKLVHLVSYYGSYICFQSLPQVWRHIQEWHQRLYRTSSLSATTPDSKKDKYSMLGWFLNHRACFWRVWVWLLTFSARISYTKRISRSLGTSLKKPGMAPF